MNFISNWLDRTTMYRVVLYVLAAWIGCAAILSLSGALYFSLNALALSLLTVLGAGVATHYVWRELTDAPSNIESSLITLLILYFLFDPVTDWRGLIALGLIATLAISTKYIFSWRKLHLFNPVALAAFLSSLLGLGYATWWIGGVAFIIPVALGGLLITLKIRRQELVLTTLATAGVSYLIATALSHPLHLEDLTYLFLSSPLIFFVTVMVTEPLTTPAGKVRQRWYAIFIGVFSAIHFDFGLIYSSLPLTLLLANAGAYLTTLRARITLTLKHIEEIAVDTFAFHFTPHLPFSFTPGQYLEWSLPHRADNRGMRRYFTIASAPHEDTVVLGVKIPKDKASSFKKTLVKMKPGDTMSVTARHGDFVLPAKPEAQPLVFIAGGIGVTPFRSHVAHLLATKQKVNATLFYCVRSESDLAWRDFFQSAETAGLITVPVVADPAADWGGETGFLTKELVAQYVESPLTARYYLSGPAPMVDAYKKLLKEMGVKKSNIVTDYFPGLA